MRDPVDAAAGSLASLASSGREKESSAACEKRGLHHVDEIRCQPLGSNNAGEDAGRLEVVEVTPRARRVVSPSTDAEPSRPPGTAQCPRARMLAHRFSTRSIEAVGPSRARSIAELSAAGAQACRFGAPQRHRRGSFTRNIRSQTTRRRRCSEETLVYLARQAFSHAQERRGSRSRT
jgi:hypothetical protein